mmetsp:Transcript_51655/g.112315  ORF Transcript_51655/g.112315 Transcript_51655/m.112315 type:complete len:127 (+) Transcript_51655:37-417(+)
MAHCLGAGGDFLTSCCQYHGCALGLFVEVLIVLVILADTGIMHRPLDLPVQLMPCSSGDHYGTAFTRLAIPISQAETEDASQNTDPESASASPPKHRKESTHARLVCASDNAGRAGRNTSGSQGAC